VVFYGKFTTPLQPVEPGQPAARSVAGLSEDVARHGGTGFAFKICRRDRCRL